MNSAISRRNLWKIPAAAYLGVSLANKVSASESNKSKPSNSYRTSLKEADALASDYKTLELKQGSNFEEKEDLLLKRIEAERMCAIKSGACIKRRHHAREYRIQLELRDIYKKQYDLAIMSGNKEEQYRNARFLADDNFGRLYVEKFTPIYQRLEKELTSQKQNNTEVKK